MRRHEQPLERRHGVPCHSVDAQLQSQRQAGDREGATAGHVACAAAWACTFLVRRFRRVSSDEASSSPAADLEGDATAAVRLRFEAGVLGRSVMVWGAEASEQLQRRGHSHSRRHHRAGRRQGRLHGHTGLFPQLLSGEPRMRSRQRPKSPTQAHTLAQPDTRAHTCGMHLQGVMVPRRAATRRHWQRPPPMCARCHDHLRPCRLRSPSYALAGRRPERRRRWSGQRYARTL